MRWYETTLAIIVLVCGYVLIKSNGFFSKPKNQSHECVSHSEEVNGYVVHYGWYDCVKMERGDLVVFTPFKGAEPQWLRAHGTPGDRFKLVRSSDGQAWTIEVNGKAVKHQGEALRFGSSATPALSLYEAAQNGLLDQSSVILFSDVNPGANDSGSLGVLSIRDIKAKVKPIE